MSSINETLKGISDLVMKEMGKGSVDRFAFQVGEDSGGDSAIFVSIKIPGEWPTEELRNRIRDKVRTFVRDSGREEWVYLRFEGPMGGSAEDVEAAR